MTTIDLTQLSSEQLAHALTIKRSQEKAAAAQKRNAYESLKADFADRIKGSLTQAMSTMEMFHKMIVDESGAFYEVMKEYGALRSDHQRGYTLQVDDFKVEVKSNKVKRFDERADIAAARLIDFLKTWIYGRQSGSDDPMYQLAMTLLERNRYGDLDYKSISKLYDLESKFADPEYSQIMQLFKESNVVEATAINYYFHERTPLGLWRKLEPSFNRM